MYPRCFDQNVSGFTLCQKYIDTYAEPVYSVNKQGDTNRMNSVYRKMRITNLEDAKKRIRELEKEVNRLKTENERLLGSMGGRKKHDDAWMASYNDFAVKYDNGMTIMEIVSEGNISRRTAYRYLKYFRSINGNT